MKSLLSRLMLACALAITVFWLGWGLFLAWWTWEDERGFADSSLRETAQMVLQSMPSDCRAVGRPGSPGASPGEAPEGDFVMGLGFELWCHGERLIRSPQAPALPVPAPSFNGFTTQSLGSAQFRSYVLQDPARGLAVRVSRDRSTWLRTTTDAVSFAMINALLLLLPLLLSLRWMVRWSFKPVAALRAALQQRAALELAPLPTAGLPVELQQLVESFNRMLHRQHDAIEQERRFVVDAAHELRTPLAVLAAQAHVARQAADPQAKDDALAQLAAGVERSARLSAQLLALARVDADARAPDAHGVVDLGELVVLLARDCEFQARQQTQQLVLELEPALVWGDLDQLGMLVRNLLDNALNYAGRGGRIECSLRPDAAGPAQQAGAQPRPAGWARLTIADNGPGVPTAQYPRLFERFYRVPGNTHAGSGIGLSLVARIAELHDAQVELGQGLQGRGLGVTVWLPNWLDPQALSQN